MKTRRFFAILVTLALVLVLAVPGVAGAGNALTDGTNPVFGARTIEVGITMTSDAAGAFTAANVDSLLTAAGHKPIRGYKLMRVIANPNNSAYPSANSSLYVKDEDGADYLAGFGATALDATGSATDADTVAFAAFLDSAGSTAAPVPARSVIVTIADNVTASAVTVVVTLVFVQ